MFQHGMEGGAEAAAVTGRRITADSFRMLTSKLAKKDATASTPPAAKQVEANPPPQHYVEPFAPAAQLAEPEPVWEPEAIFSLPAEPPAIAAPETLVLPEPEIAAVIEALDELPASHLADFELPVFQPLAPFETAPEAIPDAPQPAAPESAGDPTGLDAFVAELQSLPEPEIPRAEPEPPALNLDVEFEPLPEPQSEPHSEAEVAPATDPEAAGEPPVVDLPFAESDQIAEPASAEPEPLVADIGPEIEELQSQPHCEAEAAPEPETETAPAELDMPSEPVAAVVEPESEPSAALQPPAATVTSPLAAHVVETMMKPIIEAIYAKPSASERAMFLHEMAAIGEDGGGSSLEPGEEHPETASPKATAADISLTLAGKLGPASSLLLKPAAVADPFAKTEKDAILLGPQPDEGDEDAGKLARSLLEMMSSTAGSGLPQERALAADTLLRLVHRIPVKQLLVVVDRLAIMDEPPQLIVSRLIRDPRPEISGPLLERCLQITDLDLIGAADGSDTSKQRMIARRRIISPGLSDHLIAQGDPSVLLTLIRNPGASLSHGAYYRLAEQAGRHHSLLAPLSTRSDLPAPVAFELFWLVPAELRRFIISRFLTDSETLNKILKITMAMESGAEAGQQPAEAKFPNKELIENVVDLAVKGKLEEAADVLAGIGGICAENALRIISDRDGEPIAVVLKAMGYARSRFADTIERLKHSECAILRSERNTAELQNIFDTLSFNKARILLTYWDWAAQKSGPYALQN